MGIGSGTQTPDDISTGSEERVLSFGGMALFRPIVV